MKTVILLTVLLLFPIGLWAGEDKPDTNAMYRRIGDDLYKLVKVEWPASETLYTSGTGGIIISLDTIQVCDTLWKIDTMFTYDSTWLNSDNMFFMSLCNPSPCEYPFGWYYAEKIEVSPCFWKIRVITKHGRECCRDAIVAGSKK